MKKRNLLQVIAAAICVGSIAASLSGCAHGYRLEGKRTWDTPAPAAKGEAYIPQQNASNSGSQGGNTSFVR